MEEHDLDDMGLRGVNLGHESVQVFARPLVPKMSKNGEVDACHRRWASGGSIWSSSRGMKPKVCRVSSLVRAGDHRPGRNIEIYPDSGKLKGEDQRLINRRP